MAKLPKLLSFLLALCCSGVSATCLSLDGVDDYVESDRALNISTDEVTLEAWVFPTDSSGVYEIVQVRTDDSIRVSLSYEHGRARYDVDGRSSGSHPIPINQWTHLAVTVGNEVRSFSNGSFEGGGCCDTLPLRLSSKVSVGIDAATEDQFFKGWIDEVRIWEDWRTDEEIAANFDHPLVGTEEGLLVYYDFEEGSGDAVSDRTGNGLDGNLVNGAGFSSFSPFPAPRMILIVMWNPSEGGGLVKLLMFGFAPDATDGLDTRLGEVELPPVPPRGAFDARFVIDGTIGSTVDVRDRFTSNLVWEMRFQPNSSGYPMILSWDPADLPEGDWRMTDLQDGALGLDLSMNDQSWPQWVTDPTIEGVKITATLAGCVFDLPAGWSMISLCGSPISGDSTLATNFPNAISLFRFATGYHQATEMMVGEGYWINMLSAEIDTILVSPATTVTVDLPPSWSMVGGPAGSVDVPTLLTANADLISIFGFSSGYFQPMKMESGQGYWLNMAAANQVSMTAAAARPVPQSLRAEASAGPILWVSEGEGRQVVDLGVDAERVTELPPMPPAGLLDARVHMGDVQSLQVPLSTEPQEYDLAIQGANTLGWEIPVGAEGRWQVVLSDEVVDLTGTGTRDLVGSVTLRLRDTGGQPTAYRLGANFPNPFNPSTTIRYDLEEDGPVSLSVYDMAGQLVRELVDETQAAGSYQLEWDGHNDAGQTVSSGVYLYEMRAGRFRSVNKMLLMK